MKGLGYDSSSLSSRSATFALLKKLCAGQEEFEAVTGLLFKPNSQISGAAWGSHDLDVMKERNDILQSFQATAMEILAQTPSSVVEKPTHEIWIPGWSRSENRHWKCCPIGVYHANSV